MPLLRLVPLNDQTVPERQRSAGVSGTIMNCQPFLRSLAAIAFNNEEGYAKGKRDIQLIAIEQRPRQSRLNVLHGLGLEFIFGLEFFRRLYPSREETGTSLH